MGYTSKFAPNLLRDAAETHPRLAPVLKRLEGLGIERPRAVALVRALLTHAIEDLGDSWLGETGRRLKRIDHLRGRIAAAVDGVIETGALPPDLNRASLAGLFDDLQREMETLQSAQRFADAHPPTPDVARMRGATPPREIAAPRPPPVPTAPQTASVSHMQGAMADLAQKKPQQVALLRSVMATESGDELGMAIMAHSQGEQERLLGNVIRNHEPPLSAQDQAELREAVQTLGRAQSMGAQGQGTLAAARRAKALEGLPEDLRAAAIGDNTVLGPLAEANRPQLLVLWKKWRENGAVGSFREYVYGEMRSSIRPNQAEYQAAFDAASQHGLSLLKDPAAFDPAMPNKRMVNPREGGTDLLGFRDDGEIWYLDDKSHRNPARAPMAVSSVSAFEGTFPQNMLDDAAEIEAGFARQRAAGFEPDARAVDAARRVRACGEELKTMTAGWSDANFAEPANQARVAAVLGKPEYRIKLKVTSTMGDVQSVTGRLSGLGIDVVPPFAPRPWPPMPQVP
jgi:hypothetical protein